MSASSASTTPPTGGLTRKIIQRIIYGIVVLVALLLILITALVHHFTYDACANIDGRQKKVPFGFHLEGDDQCVANPLPPAPKVLAPTERPWSIQTLDIPDEGLRVYLYQGWKDWPIGGPITITPDGGQPLHDEPGVINHFGFQADGMYTVRANPIGSKRQIQLYNRW